VLDRIVSLGSFLVVVFSAVLFGMAAWWTFAGKIGEGDGYMLLAGCVLAAIVFSYRAQDPAWLDPVSIVKR
jgi:F0F1-type ATP synthase assembly protein I